MFDIVPDHDLNIMSAGQTLNGIVAKVISGVDGILEVEKPDAVLVQGDTSTVMGAAIAAFNQQVPIIHLEAGLRSGDINSPFPEEANRKLTSQISSLHLAPTTTSKFNLTREDFSENDIVVTGNSVIDALLYATNHLEVHFDDSPIGSAAPCEDRRPSRTRASGDGASPREPRRSDGAPSELPLQIWREIPGPTIVFPMHKNP